MITPKATHQSLKKRSVFVPIAALAAGVDAADIPLCRIPCSGQVIGINIIPQDDDAGIDASNTSVWLFEVGSTSLGGKTYNNVTLFPDKGVVGAMTLSTTEANLKRLEGDVVTYSITNGTTAATPASIVEIEYVISDAALFDTMHPAVSAT